MTLVDPTARTAVLRTEASLSRPPPATGAIPGPGPGPMVELAARLRSCLHADGGFTVRLPSGEPVSDGVSVCDDPASTLRFHADEWDTGRVARWIAQWEHRLAREAVHLGGWLDQHTNHVVLDLVVVFPDHLRERAVAHGRHHRQRAAFDLTNDRLIPLRDPRPPTRHP